MYHIPNHCALELIYEKSLRQTDLLYDEERIRRLRLQILLHEDENDHLHEQLAQDDNCIDELEGLCSQLQTALDAARDSLERAQSEVRLKSREIETLKIELHSLHGVTMDSTKLLTEKLALAREVSSLKPEIDHLRSQANSHQSVLSEKLALQRELNTLQEKLLVEKRASDRATSREKKSQTEEIRLFEQIETLQAEVGKERRERHILETESQNLSASWETKTRNLESRLDVLRIKLRTVKDQLKDCQEELQAARSTTQVGVGRPSFNTNARDTGKDIRKRTASLVQDDTMIGTPGDVRAVKRSKQASALPGDKSTFSITPFLNRTTSVEPGDPSRGILSSDTDQENVTAVAAPALDSPTAEEGRTLSRNSPSAKPGTNKAQRKLTGSFVSEKAKSRKNNIRRPAARKPQSSTILEKVTEEAHDTTAEPATTATMGAEVDSVVGDTTMNLDAKRKRRKLLGGGLGRTLFDDDDNEAVRGVRNANKVRQNVPAPVRVSLGGPKAGFLSGGPVSGFGGFSPLKKDRKAGAA